MRTMTGRKGGRAGQIQFGESLMVVIILVFLLVIGIVFYHAVSSGSVREEIAYREEVESLALAKNVLALPEVACGRLAARGPGCVDELKLRALAGIIEGEDSAGAAARAYYEDLFGRATITVHDMAVDPSQPEASFTLYEQDPGRETRRAQQLFTTLYDPVAERTTMAYLSVERHAGGAP